MPEREGKCGKEGDRKLGFCGRKRFWIAWRRGVRARRTNRGALPYETVNNVIVESELEPARQSVMTAYRNNRVHLQDLSTRRSPNPLRVRINRSFRAWERARLQPGYSPRPSTQPASSGYTRPARPRRSTQPASSGHTAQSVPVQSTQRSTQPGLSGSVGQARQSAQDYSTGQSQSRPTRPTRSGMSEEERNAEFERNFPPWRIEQLASRLFRAVLAEQKLN